MRYAIIDGEGVNAFVENIIIADESEREGLQVSLGKQLLDATPLGLGIGDLYNGTHWTRNIDGEQVALPIEEPNADIDALLALLEGRTDELQAAKLTPEQTARIVSVRSAMDVAVQAVKQSGDIALLKQCTPILRVEDQAASADGSFKSL